MIACSPSPAFTEKSTSTRASFSIRSSRNAHAPLDPDFGRAYHPRPGAPETNLGLGSRRPGYVHVHPGIFVLREPSITGHQRGDVYARRVQDFAAIFVLAPVVIILEGRLCLRQAAREIAPHGPVLPQGVPVVVGVPRSHLFDPGPHLGR